MRLNIRGLVSVVVIVLLGVGGFAYWSKSQSKIPQIYYLEFAEEKAIRAGENFLLPSSIENQLAEYDYITLSESDFQTKLIDDKYGENALLEREQVFIRFPNDRQGAFALSEGGPTVNELIDWSIENNRDELYLMFDYDDPNLKFENIEIPFDIIDALNPSNILESIFSPLEAHANSIPSPTGCNTGYYSPSGGLRYMLQLDNCSPYLSGYTFVWKYGAYQCHFDPMEEHAYKNIYDHNGSQGMVACMNDHNSQTYMCAPQNTKVTFFNGNSHPQYRCSRSSNVYGCASVGSGTVGTPPLTSVNQWIDMREGKFRSNMWLVRHEAQHNYGYTHGSSAGNCGSFGNSKFEKHCCNNHKYH